MPFNYYYYFILFYFSIIMNIIKEEGINVIADVIILPTIYYSTP